MSILKAENLTKMYEVGQEKIFAIKNISFEIDKGEFVAITGKSGSGKSTLMHIIGLLDSPTTGKLYLNGKDVSDISDKDKSYIRNKDIGFVFQFFNLLPRTTALDNVLLPLQYGQFPKNKWIEKAKNVLERVELGNRMYNKSNELSGGQKQRVAIARALVTEPTIILADEPTGNLDTRTSEEIEKLFKELNAEGKTIIIVTHDSDLAKIAKRKIVLLDGEIVK